MVGVGGTTLLFSSGVYGSESGWTLGGGGISHYYSQPNYQKGVVTQSNMRPGQFPTSRWTQTPAAACPFTITTTMARITPWLQVGGTSLASPMWAGVISIANQGRVLNGLGTLNGPSETLPKLYALPSSNFHDVTTGNNGYAAKAGYDLVPAWARPSSINW